MKDVKSFLKIKRQKAEYRAVCERIKDFKEVTILREEEHSKEQASRCMDCGIPFCHWGCPIGNYIPEWNDSMLGGYWQKAFLLLDATNNLPEITGRICPALCEYSCVLGINDDPVTVRENELDIIEYAFKNGIIKAAAPKIRSGKRIAVIGSGPAGLSCSAQLNKAGHKVAVFEKDDRVGGILRYGIPEFKLEKCVLDRRLKIWQKEGIEFRTNINIINIFNADIRKLNTDKRRFQLVVNPRLSVCNLRESALKSLLLKEQFDVVCLAGGSRVPRDLKIEDRDLKGIHFAMDYLTQSNRRINTEKIPQDNFINTKNKRVVVIGGGDTGADCVGTAHRQGAGCVVQIEILPKPPECRTKDYLWPKYPMLLKTSTSHEEGGNRHWSVLTKRFVGKNGHVEKIQCVQIQFGPEKDAKNCPLMKEVKGSEFEIEADLVILALGFLHPEHYLPKALGIELDSRGNIKTDANYMTSKKGIFCAGDMRRGQSLIVWAIAEGRRTAHCIDKYLMGKSNLPVV